MAFTERITLGVRLAIVLALLSLLFAGSVYFTQRDIERMTANAERNLARDTAAYHVKLDKWYQSIVLRQARQLAAPFLWGVETLEGVEEGTPEARRLQRRMWQFVYGHDTQPAVEERPGGPLESVVIVNLEHRIVAATDPLVVDMTFTDPAEIALLDAALETPQTRTLSGRTDGRTVSEVTAAVPNAKDQVIGLVRLRYVGTPVESVPLPPVARFHSSAQLQGPLLAGAVAILGVAFGILATAQVVRLTRRIDAMARGVPLPPTKGPGARALSVIEGKLGILSDAVRRDDIMVASLTEALQEGVVLLDSTGRVVVANRLASELLGLTGLAGTALNQRFRRLLDACPELAGVVVEGLERGQAVREKSLFVAPESGARPVAVQMTSYVLHDGQRTAGIMLVVKDRATIGALERNLREASRLQAIAQLTDSFAHEVKNPLGAVGVHLENLRRRLTRDERRDEYAEERLRVIREEVERLRGILEEWLRFTAPEERATEFATIDTVFDSVARLLRVEARHQGVELSVEPPPAPARVGLSDARLRQVLVNLALNALQAMPGGGHLWLRAVPRDGEIHVEVQDDGSGIADEVKGQVFEFRFTTKTDGSGLGLAICRRIIEEAGGRLTFESQLGRGTTFTIALKNLAADDGR